MVELTVAIALLTLLTAAALRTLLALGRQSVAVSEHASVQAGVRAGLLLARAELRELGGDAAGGDLLRLDRDSVTYRAVRGFGITCALAPTQVRILDAPPLPFSRLRSIAPGRDSLLLFVDGDTSTPADDGWVGLPVLATGASTCAGIAAIAVETIDMTPYLPTRTLADVGVGGPVRTFEVTRLAEYVSGGQQWLGMASVSGGEAIQPVAGPLAGDGLTLDYFDASGMPVLNPADVRSLRVTLVGAGERRVVVGWTGGPRSIVAETVAARWSLRNVRR